MGYAVHQSRVEPARETVPVHRMHPRHAEMASATQMSAIRAQMIAVA
jgi:hypothetical protein